MGMNEDSTVRMMRALVKSMNPGDQVYAYSFAQALNLEPQRVTRVFKRWHARGYLNDCGKVKLPEGQSRGPDVRMYEITEDGFNEIKKSLDTIDKQRLLQEN